jgi:hypothetical protein
MDDDQSPLYAVGPPASNALVVRPPWNAMFVFQFLRVKSHIAAVNSAWMVH